MNSQLAVKQLTASDLTFFEWHFRNRNAGNQKAINLNANVFIDQLFPTLPILAEQTGGRFGIDLYLYGPGLGTTEHNLQRKIVKIDSYKNWRLNGEFIPDPLDEPERYHILIPGDLAVIEFIGDARPEAARIVLVARETPSDARLHQLLSSGVHKMGTLARSELERAVTSAAVSPDHPIRVLLAREELKEAAESGETPLVAAAIRGPARTITLEELLQARRAAGVIGEEGEALINNWLELEKRAGRIKDFTWESQSNAAAPFDFLIVQTNGDIEHVDVKTTSREAARPFHLSAGELRYVVESGHPYRIYRVAQIGEGSPNVGISDPINTWARNVSRLLENLPSGVEADGLLVSPAVITFSTPIVLPLIQSERI